MAEIRDDFCLFYIVSFWPLPKWLRVFLVLIEKSLTGYTCIPKFLAEIAIHANR